MKRKTARIVAKVRKKPGKKTDLLVRKQSVSKESDPPVHPWRVCPYGQHQVKTHALHEPPSKKKSAGSISTRHFHCANNPSGKDELRPYEIQQIATLHFSALKNRPCPLPLKWSDRGNLYDYLIAGWVQYWNEVLKPDEPLDPNLVKGLIASESNFLPSVLADPTKSNSARGLMQVTNLTRKLLSGDHQDLKDHYIMVTKSDLNDPNINICAGVRWLFEKRRLSSHDLKRPATWVEAVWAYKDISDASSPAKKKQMIAAFGEFYEELKKCDIKR